MFLGIKDLLPRFSISRKEDEYVELPIEEEEKEKLTVRIENLGGVNDVDRLIKLVKGGNILILKTKLIRKKDLGQFQNSVQKLKRLCHNFGFDIAATSDGFIICTPRFAKIERG